jgi:hypothetical protein
MKTNIWSFAFLSLFLTVILNSCGDNKSGKGSNGNSISTSSANPSQVDGFITFNFNRNIPPTFQVGNASYSYGEQPSPTAFSILQQMADDVAVRNYRFPPVEVTASTAKFRARMTGWVSGSVPGSNSGQLYFNVSQISFY